MKKRFFLSLISALLAFALLLPGCSSSESQSLGGIEDYFTLTQNNNSTYSYTLKDKQGNVLYQQHNETRVPEAFQVSDAVFAVKAQSGTGLASSYTVYWDVEKGLVSPIYYYVLATKDQYLVRADYQGDENFIIVQDIFDENGHYSKYKLRKVSLTVDFAVSCTFNSDGDAVVTYCTGTDFTHTQITVKMP